MAKTVSGRVPSGISGFDELTSGGIPKGSLLVVSGDPGSGKTILCMQFLNYGVENGEKSVYISLEESEEEIISTAERFGWPFGKYVEEGKLEIITIELYDFDKLRDTIEDTVMRLGASRVVIDPGIVFRLYFERELDARKRIVALGKMLKGLGATTIITNEISLGQETSLYGLEEYVADGVVLMYHTKLQNRFIRSVAILKMRNTKIAEKLYPLQISASGITVLPKQEIFEKV